MLPGTLSYLVILAPLILALLNPEWAAWFIVAYMLLWFFKAMAMGYRVLQGYNRMEHSMTLDWPAILDDVNDPENRVKELMKSGEKIDRIHAANLQAYIESDQDKLKPDDVINVSIIATHNESEDILRPTFESILSSKWDHKHKHVIILAYEERGGPKVEAQAKALIKEFKGKFLHAEAVKHPDGLPGEVRGKGGNITRAGFWAKDWIKSQKIDPDKVIVSTWDSDNRPDPNYYSCLAYTFLVSDDRKYKSYQPVTLYSNNIWDVPAPARVVAVSSSFWWIVQSVRPHALRNFSAHSQPLSALIDTGFWSTRTIVEDGHQFWRTYVRYNGKHDTVPLYIPNYQDAVLAKDYKRTLKEQFIQLRRWAWGASDVPYMISKGFKKGSKIPKGDLIFKLARLTESHVSWASSSLILLVGAWIPLVLAPNAEDSLVAQQLPGFASRTMTLSMVGIFITMYFSLKILPPRPDRYKRRHHWYMVFQWVLVPVISIVYGSAAGLYSQTRLFTGIYLDKFDATVKEVKKD